jgi:methyl-accepting chemotaxis protein
VDTSNQAIVANQTQEQKLTTEKRAEELYLQYILDIHRNTDNLLAYLLVLEWIAAMVVAYTVSPTAWKGSTAYTHPHIYYALWLGGAFAILPLFLIFKYNGQYITRLTAAICQILMSALLIHLTGGRIETHFSVFGSLAIIAFYRDLYVLIPATVVVAAHHFLFGVFLPESIYGLTVPDPLRWLEHAGWVVFEDVFLVIACVQNTNQMRALAKRQAELEHTDELQLTLTDLAAARSELIDRTDHIANVVSVLAESGDKIASILSELATNAQETLAAITETAAVAEEVRQTAEVCSNRAKLVADDAKTATQISEQGRRATDDTVDGMQRIRDQMTAIADSMAQLNNQSKMIAEIIAAVDDLAQQSSLLSVNASIEAARAGEHGKGFAIVAQEVKNLSQESKNATAHVRRILGDIIRASAESTTATDSGSRAVSAGEEVVKQAKSAILALTESVGQAAQTAAQIDVSSKQQLVGMQQVVTAMESVKQASNQSVKRITELNDALTGLNDLGKQLKTLVEQASVRDNNGHQHATFPPTGKLTAVVEQKN